MVMGPTHSMSGAAVWLVGTAIAAAISPFNPSLSMVILGTTVMAGAAIACDFDSNSATAVRSFGFMGTLVHQIVDGISVLVYNLTRAKYDKPRENGHRTLFHTAAMATLIGIGVSSLASITTPVEVLGKDFTLGQIFSLLVMFIMLHLGIAGLFEKQVKRMKKKIGVYGLLLSSLVITSIVGYALPENETFPWLGLCVGGGMIVHCFGDAITKMGVPLLWPLKIKGKRWYDITLPSLIRIKAGGKFEYVFLLPALTIITIGAALWHIPGAITNVTSMFS